MRFVRWSSQVKKTCRARSLGCRTSHRLDPTRRGPAFQAAGKHKPFGFGFPVPKCRSNPGQKKKTEVWSQGRNFKESKFQGTTCGGSNSQRNFKAVSHGAKAKGQKKQAKQSRPPAQRLPESEGGLKQTKQLATIWDHLHSSLSSGFRPESLKADHLLGPPKVDRNWKS